MKRSMISQKIKSIAKKGIACAVTAAFLGMSSISYSCVDEANAGQGVSQTSSSRCIPCDSDLKISNNSASIGTIYLGQPDANWLADCKNFEIFEGHKGGLGDTLEIVGCNKEIYLIWAYSGLRTVVVNKGWNGKINGKDVQPGDSLEIFIRNFPNAKPCREGVYQQDFWYPRHLNAFHKDGVITGIRISEYPIICDYDSQNIK
ncbi:MAG: hypothetical protein NT001_00350 [Candidatus Woesearchaeota archaeon]|nr:hypothetical protein [Candidatus Woesearchaeota archaeon]